MKGIIHESVGVQLTQAEWEGEATHNIASGAGFPGAPAEKDLFYKTDEHKWYIYNGTGWQELTRVYTDTEAISAVEGASPINFAEYILVDSGNVRLQSTATDNFELFTNTNTPSPNIFIGYGDGAGNQDATKEHITITGGKIKINKGDLQLNFHDGGDEGGEVLFHSALDVPTNPRPEWYIDVYAGTLRLRGYDSTNHKTLLSLDFPNLNVIISEGKIIFIGDVNLYRSAANVLKTDDALVTGDHITVDSGEVRLLSTGADNFQLLTKSNTPNPNLLIGYGSGAWAHDSGREYIALSGGAIRLLKGDVILTDGKKIQWSDVNLYRTSQNWLKTDDSFQVAGDLQFGTHHAIGAKTVTGYITITDNNAQVRYLAVVS